MTDNDNMSAAKIIYKILSSFERQLDNLIFDMDELAPRS